jgi:hypothetical protein
VQLANVHLDLAGDAAFGHYSAKVSAEGLASIGTNATEASALGLDVRRVTDGTSQRIDSAVMPTGDGGVYIRIPRIAFSSPQLKVYGRQAGAGHNATLAPDPPRWSGASALDRGAALRFNRPFFDGGATLSSYTGRCTAPGETAMTRAVKEPGRVEVVGLSNDVAYTCQVRAQNAAGKLSRWTYFKTVTPAATAPAPAPRVNAPARTTDASAKKQARISWSAPVGVTYAPGTTFALTRSANGSATWRTLASGTTATSRTVSVRPGNTYRFKVTAKEPGNAASAATMRTVVAPFDDAAAAMKYAGTWRLLRADNRHLGGVHRTKAAGATVTLTRKGSRVWIIGDRGRTTGEFRVRIDGGAWSRYVDTRSATSRVRAVLWTSKILRNKEHTVRIQVRGTSGRPMISVDGIAFLR